VTVLALRALDLAERYGVTIAVVAGNRLWWLSRGPTPGRALEALKAAKGELINLLARYRLDSAGGLAGDDVLAALQVRGVAVRRYGVNAALDDALCGALARVPPTSLLYAFADRQAEYGLALRALRAMDCLQAKAEARSRDESAVSSRTDKPDEKPSAAMAARELLGHLRHLGFRAYLDRSALLIADATGHKRDLSRFMNTADVFSKLATGLADEPGLLNVLGHQGR
jgi:hypothetical protein